MKNRFIPLIIFVLVSLLLALLIKDFVRVVIVGPLLYFFWYLILFLESLPEFTFWTLFILVALVIAYKSLSGKRKQHYQGLAEKANQEGSVATWSRLLEHADRGGYSMWQLSQSLNKLTWHLLGDGETLSLQKIDQRIRDGDLTLPPEIEAYFRSGLHPYQPRSRFSITRRKLPKNLAPLELDPELVVRFLEEQTTPSTGEEV